MAMRGPAVRPRIVGRPVYEDFKPVFEWKEDESSDLLLIYLPGFMKEYLKVTIEGRNTVRIRGERLVAGNKWSRFQEDYQIPEHANATGIRAKFERGILTVTMPRKVKVVPHVPVVPPTTERMEDTNITKPIPENTSTAAVEKGEISDTKGTSKERPPIISEANVNQNNFSNDEKFSPRPITKQEAVSSEPKVNDIDKHVTNNKERYPPIKTEDITSEQKVKHKTTDEGNIGRHEIKDEKPISHEPKGIHEELPPKKSSRNTDNEESLEKKAKEKSRNASDHNKDIGESKLDYLYKKVAMGKNEERQLLVNIGIAVLVIVALGTYVYYTQG